MSLKMRMGNLQIIRIWAWEHVSFVVAMESSAAIANASDLSDCQSNVDLERQNCVLTPSAIWAHPGRTCHGPFQP